ncbi:tyrosine-type recombinase/integrase [Streptomyces decoyicus]|uniref:tyrosine-type recombinase/integrase n=1 Tax=Streptomyces decoyicus TaxID=249567 RepID=UPI0033BAF4C7
MPGYIEDRWLTKRPDPATGKRRQTPLYGKGKRYKVTGIPGVRSRSFDRKADADTWLADAQSKSRADEFVDPRAGNMTLREYVESHWWPALTADPATLETVKGRVWGHILPHLGELPLRQIKVGTLRIWLKALEGGISPGTANAAWGYLSNILEYAIDDERLTKNPCKAKTISPPKMPTRKARAWPAQQVSAVRAGLHSRYQILVDIGAGAGLRQGEAFGLAVEDIDEAAGVIHVRRQVKRVAGKLVFAPPKGGKEREVPLPGLLAARIRVYRRDHPSREITLPWKDPRPPATKLEEKDRAPRTHRLLVTNKEGGAIRAWSWNQHYWKKALAAAGVIPTPPAREKGSRANIAYGPTREHGYHCLRHTFASVQLDARESVVSVSKWMGHGDPAITLRVYAHFMPEADGRGRRAMDAWFQNLPEAGSDSQKISLDSPQLPDEPGEEAADAVAPNLNELAAAASPPSSQAVA